MTREWIELLALVLLALFVWVGLAVIVRELASGERGAAPPRVAPTGTGPAQATGGAYADVARDYRGHGDEDPLRYGKCARCGGPLGRTRDGMRCQDCGMWHSPPAPTAASIRDLERRLAEQGGDTIPVAKPYGLPDKWDPDILATLKRVRRKLRWPWVARRRDGIQLSDEETKKLLDDVLGQDPPA